MIITERQIHSLMQIAGLYLRVLDQLSIVSESSLTDCGKHNKIAVANLLQDIASQQCTKEMVIQ